MLFIADPVLLGSEAIVLPLQISIGLVTVIVEFALLKWIFGHEYRWGLLSAPVTAKRTFVIALVANLASFVTAFIGFGFLTSLIKGI